jgi:hypothetical protein
MRLPSMRTALLAPALAILMAATAPHPALAGICAMDARLCFPPSRDMFDPRSTEFDLGIDVSFVGTVPADVRAFVMTLPAYAQRTIVTACHHYLTVPNAVHSRATRQFCQALLLG